MGLDTNAHPFDRTLLREAAEYALRHNMGYLEAAEVYSGPLGWLN